MEPLRVAVFGCGAHARAWHLKEYAALPGVQIAAVVDVDAERARTAAAEWNAGTWFTDHREALARTQPHLVSIVSPPLYHHRQALDAFAAGAHVLCEKPLAMSAREAREMTDAAKAAGRFLSMGLQSRHLQAARLLRDYLATGALGDVYFTRVWCGHVMNIPGWGHFHRKELAGGGVVMATTVHILDLALWVLGNPRPRSVTAFNHARLPRMREPAVTWDGPVEEDEVEDFSHAVVRFENESWMSLESNWLKAPSPRPTGIEFLAHDGRAALHPLLIERHRGREVEDVTPAFEENPNPVGSFLQEAARCAREGGEPVVRPEQAVQVQAVLDAIYRSAQEGREVEVEAC
jgi:predicted dehydrogenase